MAIVIDAFRTQLWPVPMLAVALAVALGVALPWFDARYDSRLPPTPDAYLFGGGADAARTVLSAIASSLITVTSLTFSLTVVTLQLASSQYSPRLLRTFSHDRFVHITLAIFLATFTYALTVLRTVRSGSSPGGVFVPEMSVTFAFVLAMASVVALVLFLAHLAREIRVETLLRRVHAEAKQTGHRLLPNREGPEPPRGLAAPPSGARPVPSPSSGFLTAVNELALLKMAAEQDGFVLVDRIPGDSLVEGVPLGLVWLRDEPSEAAGRRSCGERLDRLAECLRSAISTGFERVEVQDVGFGLRQLTDVACRALSSGINDPTTAVHALGHSAAFLSDCAGRRLGPVTLCDDDGVCRVTLRRPDLAMLLELAIAQLRRYGANEPVVQARLLALLRELAWVVDEPAGRDAIADQLRRVQATLAGQDFDITERARLIALSKRVEQALGGQWTVDDC